MDGNIEERKRLPLVEDLELHLSTIFAVRLKKYIEIRLWTHVNGFIVRVLLS